MTGVGGVGGVEGFGPVLVLLAAPLLVDVLVVLDVVVVVVVVVVCVVIGIAVALVDCDVVRCVVVLAFVTTLAVVVAASGAENRYTPHWFGRNTSSLAKRLASLTQKSRRLTAPAPSFLSARTSSHRPIPNSSVRR